MTFAAPWLLAALLTLPALYWLLRVTPPAPRRQEFPATRLLLDLQSRETPARTPRWLLLLRMAAAACVILGLAGPMRGARQDAPPGPLLVVVDDGWAAASDWTLRLDAADRALAAAEAAARPAILLTTAPGEAGGPPAPAGPMPAHALRAVLATLRPKPWPTDRAAAAVAFRNALRAGAVGPGAATYVGDGVAGHDGGFADLLASAGPLAVVAAASPAAQILRATALPDGWAVRVSQVPRPVATRLGVHATAADGRVLAQVPVVVAAGAAAGEAALTLPTELRNRVDRLGLDGPGGRVASAAAVVLLDEADRRRPVGLLTAADAIDAPLTGSGFFLRRALAPFSEWREGTADSLLARPVSVLLSADQPMQPGAEADRLRVWVEAGGVLVRFAGPEIAQAAQDQQADPLLPVALLAADRQLGGSMSWGHPAKLAPPPAGSPFVGLSSADVSVTRQVLADPAADLGNATWARLSDGTPLVTQRPIGAGRVVLFHVTANADWSDLPLSGLFVDMLRRVLAVSTGVGGDAATTGALAAVRALDGFGVLADPPAAARPAEAESWAQVVASPQHPPGLYGPEGARRVLNLSQGLPDPLPLAVPGAVRRETLGEQATPRPFGPLLLALAAALLAIDLMASLWARGLVGAVAAMLLAVLAASPVRADPWEAALTTRLAFVVTGEAAIDDVARAGLTGLSAYVGARTAAVLAEPVGVVPGRDDLSFYPLLYWPLSAGSALPAGTAIAAVNAYMAHGGVVLIDTRDGGSGAGMAEGARDVLQRLGDGREGERLAAPPLAALTSTHVLARSFYLLSDFPGRFDGDTVWIARDTDRSNDSVSPVVIGGHDWAAAWAVDAAGQHPFATLPGGERQRTLAYRFGVNLVMYALTGNYKGDQVHVPALLQRLGQ